MEQQDWQVNKTQHECAKYMLDNQLNADVNFIVGKNQEMICANKVILSMRSPVFDRMLNGKFKEAVEDPVIPDISPDAFNTVLRYCYYDCLEVPYDLAVSTLYAAKKYILPMLENHSRQILIQKLCISNIWDIFEHSVDIGDEELQSGCRKYFNGNVATVREALHVSNFLTVSNNLLLFFLHMNYMGDDAGSKPLGSLNYSLGICIAEIELFKACNAWARAECLRQNLEPSGANKRVVLGECLPLISFPTMLYEDLVNEVYPAGILTQAEKDNLCRYKHKKPDSDCEAVFPTAQKQFLAGRCEKQIAEHWSYSGSASSSITVKSTEKVVLCKLWVKSCCQPTMVKVKDLMTERCVSMKPTIQPQIYVAVDGSPLLCLDMEPMVLKAGSKYSVTVEANKSDKMTPAPDSPSTGPFTSVRQVNISRDTRGSTFLQALTFSLV